MEDNTTHDHSLHLHVDCQNGADFNSLMESVAKSMEDSFSSDWGKRFFLWLEGNSNLRLSQSPNPSEKGRAMKLHHLKGIIPFQDIVGELSDGPVRAQPEFIPAGTILSDLRSQGYFDRFSQDICLGILGGTLLLSWGLYDLNIGGFSCSPIPCNVEHFAFVKGLPIVSTNSCKQTTTAGLTLLKNLTEHLSTSNITNNGVLPPMTVRGYGLSESNGVRTTSLVGSTTIHRTDNPSDLAPSPRDWKIEPMIVLEANIDDMTAEHLAFLCERLLSAPGVVDAWTSQIGMKKCRPATIVSCLIQSSLKDSIMAVFFENSTTLGIRAITVERYALQRQVVSVQTHWKNTERRGVVDVKLGYLNGKVISTKAEFDHCHAISNEERCRIQTVADEAVRLALSGETSR